MGYSSWLFHEKGNLPQAIKAMKKAVKFRPNDDRYTKNLEKLEKEYKEAGAGK